MFSENIEYENPYQTKHNNSQITQPKVTKTKYYLPQREKLGIPDTRRAFARLDDFMPLNDRRTKQYRAAEPAAMIGRGKAGFCFYWIITT